MALQTGRKLSIARLPGAAISTVSRAIQQHIEDGVFYAVFLAQRYSTSDVAGGYGVAST